MPTTTSGPRYCTGCDAKLTQGAGDPVPFLCPVCHLQQWGRPVEPVEALTEDAPEERDHEEGCACSACGEAWAGWQPAEIDS